jgi:hypothetical protein
LSKHDVAALRAAPLWARNASRIDDLNLCCSYSVSGSFPILFKLSSSML